jgi:hypothetical protein
MTRVHIVGVTANPDGEVELEPEVRDCERIRISYRIASGRRIIALTVFANSRMRETAEMARAAAAMASCRH